MGLFSSIAGAVTGAAGSILGGAISDKRNQAYANQMWQKNYNAQKEFAQNSIQWRVQDAKKAGIHPLYAMGQTPGYTPSDSSYSSAYGEGVSRAMNSIGQAMGQLDLSLKKEQVKGEKLNNVNKAVEAANKIATSTMAQTPKTLTPFLSGSKSGNIFTTARGNQYFVPENEMSIDDISSIKQGISTMYDVVPYDNLSKATKKETILGPLGYQVADKGKNPIRKEAADIGRKYDNPFIGVMTIPSLALKHFLNSILK